jgi:hypothetical protein
MIEQEHESPLNNEQIHACTRSSSSTLLLHFRTEQPPSTPAPTRVLLSCRRPRNRRHAGHSTTPTRCKTPTRLRWKWKYQTCRRPALLDALLPKGARLAAGS